jgi:hypothetical protein
MNLRSHEDAKSVPVIILLVASSIILHNIHEGIKELKINHMFQRSAYLQVICFMPLSKRKESIELGNFIQHHLPFHMIQSTYQPNLHFKRRIIRQWNSKQKETQEMSF